MTQVQRTDQQINRALAELMGFVIEHYGGFARVMRNGEVQCAWLPDEGYTHAFMPDYCNNPTASLEVQAKAIEKNKGKYFAHLMHIKNLMITSNTVTWCEAVALASPRERAEAAYITLSSKQ